MILVGCSSNRSAMRSNIRFEVVTLTPGAIPPAWLSPPRRVPIHKNSRRTACNPGSRLAERPAMILLPESTGHHPK